MTSQLDEKEFYNYLAKQDSWKSVGLVIQEFIQLKLKEQDKNKYSEEDIKQAFLDGNSEAQMPSDWESLDKLKEEWFEQFKKK